jgi:DNA-binding IclR family transcriptional regulator
MTGTPEGNDDVGSDQPSILSKAFAVLRSFSTSSRVMTLTDIARASGLPKSTVHRLLARLVDLGVIERHRSGYMVSLDMMNLASTNTAFGMRENALPYLAALHRWSGRAIQLSVLRGTDVIYLESIASVNGPSPSHVIGKRVPAHCTAAGKAILAWEFEVEGLTPALPAPLPSKTEYSLTSVSDLLIQLKQARENGYATEREEEQIGFLHVAAPILQYNFAVGAVSMSWRVGEAPDDRMASALRKAATLIGTQLRDALVKTGRPDWFVKEL